MKVANKYICIHFSFVYFFLNLFLMKNHQYSITEFEIKKYTTRLGFSMIETSKYLNDIMKK